MVYYRYKKERVNDIIKFCHSDIMYLDIFLESSNEVVKLTYRLKDRM